MMVTSVQPRIAVVFATMGRPHVAQRLIESIRASHGHLNIYVADQSGYSTQMDAYYKSMNCQVVWMEEDAGVCASRNAAVDLVKEEFFLLCDDDFILSTHTNFADAIQILDNNRNVGVVGGRLIDLFEDDNKVVWREHRHWELFLSLDRQNRRLTAIPAHYFAPEPKICDDVRYYICDAVMNFAVFRTDMFRQGIQWDSQFKSNGEHEDFYLTLKEDGRFAVAFVPSMVAEHHHATANRYRRLRERSDGWKRFLNKWSIDQYLEIDGGVRHSYNFDKLQAVGKGYSSYYGSVTADAVNQQVPLRSLRFSNIDGSVICRATRCCILTRSRARIFSLSELDRLAHCLRWEANGKGIFLMP